MGGAKNVRQKNWFTTEHTSELYKAGKKNRTKRRDIVILSLDLQREIGNEEW